MRAYSITSRCFAASKASPARLLCSKMNSGKDSLQGTAEAALDAGLKRALKQNSSATYHCAGSLPLGSTLDLYFKDSTGGAQRLELSGGSLSADHAALNELLKVAKPSSFGRGGEAVLDPAYRTALELPPDSFALNHVLPPAAILADIHNVLQPNAPAIEAQLYKINIYGPGAHFKSHVDTPRHERMFGSLVIALPSAFEGGQLVLRHNGATKTCDWGAAMVPPAATDAPSSSAAAPSGPSVQWVAFFSDVEHCIEPVTAGYRITLTYNLLQQPAVAPGDQQLFRSADLAHTTPLYAELKRLLRTHAWHPMGAKLGFFLEHKYAMGLRGLKDSMFPGILKGNDRLLWAALGAVGLKPQVVPVHIGWDEYECDDWNEGEGGATVPDHLAAFFEGHQSDEGRYGSSGSDDADEEWEAFLKARVMVGANLQTAVNNLEWASKDDANNKDVAEQLGGRLASGLNIIWCTRIPDRRAAYYRDHIAGYGNEPRTDIAYSGVGLLVDIPAWGSKKRTGMIMAGGKVEGEGKKRKDRDSDSE